MLPFRLVIPPQFREEMIAHAVADCPHECCGLLVGRVVEGIGLVEARYPLVNELASPVRFRSEPRSLFAAMKAMRATGTDILAVYHSHPTSPPEPSRIDFEEHYAESVACVIVSLRTPEPEVRAWWLKGKHRESIDEFHTRAE
jgi:[CysO sulfur-carrier protein]-S-L-cysteine hydrolase